MYTIIRTIYLQFLITLFNQSWCDLISLQDDLSLYLFYAPRTSRSVQRATISISKFFENRKIENFLRCGTKRERKEYRMNKMNKMLSVHVSLVARPAVFLRRFNSRFAVVQFLSSSYWIIIIIIIQENNNNNNKK